MTTASVEVCEMCATSKQDPRQTVKNPMGTFDGATMANLTSAGRLLETKKVQVHECPLCDRESKRRV